MTKNLIWLRTDSIGDAVLAGSMLPYVAQRYSDLSITAVCQEAVAPYYESCPYVSQVISFHRTALLDDEVYRNDFIEKLRSLSAVLLLNSLYSRDNLSDFIATNAGALETITLKGDRTNRLVEESNDTDVGYSKVIPNGEHSREIDRHKHFLSSLGVVDIQLEPQFW
ncbi:MAG: hypothetical protein KDD62_04710, partial [Bdellovibrionales bacterium]|nr:hypothetical protein [Bdellovibrionales bacterium]